MAKKNEENPVKELEEQSEKEAESEAKLKPEAAQEEVEDNPDEQAQKSAAMEEATGAGEKMPAEIAAVNVDTETAQEASKATKAKPSGKYKDIIKKIESFSLMELAELVKELEDRFGISAAIPQASVTGGAPQGGPAAPAAPEKSRFTVVLSGSGTNKIAVIKAIREIKQDLGLKDAKDFVEAAPKTVLEDASKDDAQKAKEKLEAAGATVELK